MFVVIMKKHMIRRIVIINMPHQYNVIIDVIFKDHYIVAPHMVHDWIASEVYIFKILAETKITFAMLSNHLNILHEGYQVTNVVWSCHLWKTHRWYPAKRALPPCLRMADRALLAGYPRYVAPLALHMLVSTCIIIWEVSVPWAYRSGDVFQIGVNKPVIVPVTRSIALFYIYWSGKNLWYRIII